MFGGQSGNRGKKQEAPPKPPPDSAGAPIEPRETLEYKAAMELEAWKEMQEDLFDNQVTSSVNGVSSCQGVVFHRLVFCLQSPQSAASAGQPHCVIVIRLDVAFYVSLVIRGVAMETATCAHRLGSITK